jgi:aromatic ring-opening dioxygenase catalytic subunit (LigB family)
MTKDRRQPSPILSRREALGVIISGAASSVACHRCHDATPPYEGKDATMTTTRMPTLFVPHGGGPWPFVDFGGLIPARDVELLRTYFVDLPKGLPVAPKALLVVSAHWEEAVPTVMTSPRPPILYDYYGFPPAAYTIQWPASGDPVLAQHVVELLGRAGIPTSTNERRGFDHGTFIPFKVSWPQADVPAVQLSLRKTLDPAEHLAIGRALAPLRDEGVLILGSGMSYHNLRSFRSPSAVSTSVTFDRWLGEAATASPDVRTERLTQWESAPEARAAHPREEHLLPLMVVAGAAGDDVGRATFNDDWMGVRLSAFQYG